MMCESCCTECMSNNEMAGMMGRCIMMRRDCAMMCTMTAMMIARGSEYAKQMCKKCVLPYVTHVQWNVKKWVIKWKHLKNVLKCAKNVSKNVEI